MNNKYSGGTMITGSSDDLIELGGELYEEFGAYNCKNGVATFSDGTYLEVEYDKDGIWRFRARFKGSLYDKKVEGDVEEDTFDEVYFKPGLKWCVFTKEAQVEIKRGK